MRIRTKKKKRLLILPLIAGILLLGGTVLAVFIIRGDDKPKELETTNQSGINFGPPTEEDKQEVDRNKEEISSENNAPPPSTQDGRAVRNPIITYAQEFDGNIEVTGYVPGVIEENGMCKVEFTNGNTRFSRESKGFADVNRTSCTPFTVPVNEFVPKGKWRITLSYSSSSSIGTSQALEIEVK